MQALLSLRAGAGRQAGRGAVRLILLSISQWRVRTQSQGHQTQIGAAPLTHTAGFVAVGPEHSVGQAGAGLFQCKGLCQALSLPLLPLLRAATRCRCESARVLGEGAGGV